MPFSLIMPFIKHCFNTLKMQEKQEVINEYPSLLLTSHYTNVAENKKICKSRSVSPHVGLQRIVTQAFVITIFGKISVTNINF